MVVTKSIGEQKLEEKLSTGKGGQGQIQDTFVLPQSPTLNGSKCFFLGNALTPSSHRSFLSISNEFSDEDCFNVDNELTDESYHDIEEIYIEDDAPQMITLNESVLEETKRLRSQVQFQEKEVSELTDQVTQLNKESSQLREKFCTTKTQLTEKEKALGDTNRHVSQLREKLESTQANLEKSQKELGHARKNVLQLTNDLRQEKSSQQARIDDLTRGRSQLETQNQGLNDENKKLSGELRRTKAQLVEKEQALKESALQLERNTLTQQTMIHDLTREKNQLEAASAQSRKQSNYASVSFVLAGTFAVSASLIVPYLGICIALTVAALAFLAVGCYCLYKANTVLNDVRTDQITNGADHAVA